MALLCLFAVSSLLAAHASDERCVILNLTPTVGNSGKDNWVEVARGVPLNDVERGLVSDAIQVIRRWETRGVVGYEPTQDPYREGDFATTEPPKSPSAALYDLWQNLHICKEVNQNAGYAMRTWRGPPSQDYSYQGPPVAIHIMPAFLDLQNTQSGRDGVVLSLATMLLHESGHVLDLTSPKGNERSPREQERSIYGYCENQMNAIVRHKDSADIEKAAASQYRDICRAQLDGYAHEGITIADPGGSQSYPMKGDLDYQEFILLSCEDVESATRLLSANAIPIVRGPIQARKGWCFAAIRVSAVVGSDGLVAGLSGQAHTAKLACTVFSGVSIKLSTEDLTRVLAPENLEIAWIDSKESWMVVYHVPGVKTAALLKRIEQAVPAARGRTGAPALDSLQWPISPPKGFKAEIKRTIDGKIRELNVRDDNMLMARFELSDMQKCKLPTAPDEVRQFYCTNVLYEFLRKKRALPTESPH